MTLLGSEATMIDTSTIDLVGLIGQNVNLRRVGHEYRGRCPFHNGTSDTSLVVWREEGSERWCCYAGCGGGDALNWIMKRDDVSFKEALRTLNLSDQAAAPARRAPHLPAPIDPPTERWQAEALRFVAHSEQRLWSDDYTRPLDYMRQRGFTDEALRYARIGYNPHDHYVLREAFGLPTYTYEDRHGETRGKQSIWLPRGIAIPWFVDGQLWRVFIRRPTADPKYYIIPGGSNAMYNADALIPGKPAVLVEAALDALAIHQAAGDIITPVATGTTGARSVKWIARLAGCTPLLLSFDRDAGGESPTRYWRGIFPAAQVWRAFGDDPAAMLQRGHDVRAWALAGVRHAGYTPPAPSYVVYGNDDEGWYVCEQIDGELCHTDEVSYPTPQAAREAATPG
jgi:hypothetical protein